MPRPHLPELLDLLEIDQIVVVDDLFAPPASVYTLNFPPGEGPDVEHLPALPNGVDYEQHVETHWPNVPLEAKLEVRRKARERENFVDPTGDPTGLARLVGDRQFTGLTLHEWTANSDRILGGARRALILFDVNFSGETGNEHGEEGLEPAGAAVKATEHHIIGLLTTKAARGGEEEAAAAWATTAHVARADLVVVNKNLLVDPGNDEDIARAVQQIRTTLQASQLRILREKVHDSLRRSIEDAAQMLSERSTSVLEDLVFKASREGGEWEGDTWFRLYGTLGLNRARRKLATDPRARHAIADVRNLIHSRADPTSADSAALAIEVQEAESYEDAEYLNTAGLPIANGDIFETKDRTKYILVGQPCDLALRPTGRARNPATATLLPIKRCQDGGAGEQSAYLLPSGAVLGDGTWEVRFRPEHHVAFDVLDLVSFNSEGRATIRPRARTVLKPLLPGLQARYDAIRKRADKLAAPLAAVDDLQAQDHLSAALAAHLRRALLNGGGPFKPTLSARPAPFAFDCRRVGRLSGSYADALLGAHSGARSRTAHAHELTRIVSDAGQCRAYGRR